jgi:ribosomal-protein-alanine N-acetyltransferase
VLETPGRRHFAEWAWLREASREHLMPFEPQWAADDLTPRGFRRRLKRYRRERHDGTAYAYLVFRAADHSLVGGVTLSNVRRGVTQAASVGYWTGLPYVRQGYASDALSAILRHAFEDMALNRVEAACLPSNCASIGVLERAGFRHEGLARRYLKINGRWQDHLLFARLAEDAWPGQRAGSPRPVAPADARHTGLPLVAAAREAARTAASPREGCTS